MLSLLIDGLDDTHSDGLLHVSYRKSSQWRVFTQCLHAQWFLWLEQNDSGLAFFEILWCRFYQVSSFTIDFLDKLFKAAGNV